MSLPLSEELLAAQSETTRSPLIRITSIPLSNALPLPGYTFNPGETDTEAEPSLIETESNRVVSVNIIGGTDVVYQYTDTDQVVFTNMVVTSPTAGEVDSTCLVEDPGVGIRIVYIDYGGGLYRLRHLLTSETGTVITADANITTYSSGSYVASDIFVARLANGTFLIVFVLFNVSTEAFTLQQITTTDWSSFSAAADITPSGLIADRTKANPSLLQEAGGDVYLFFEYVNIMADDNEMYNLFYSVSTDNGATYSAATNITENENVGIDLHRPRADIDAVGDVILTYHNTQGALHIDNTTSGWCGSGTEGTFGMHYNPATNHLFAITIYPGAGTKVLRSIIVIDTTTWTIEHCYTSGTTPGFHPVFANVHCWWYTAQGEAELVCVCTAHDTSSHAMVLDEETQTFTNYHFEDNATYSIIRNVDTVPPGRMLAAAIDATNRRLYILFGEDYLYSIQITLGYFEIDDAPDPVSGYYEFNIVFEDTGSGGIDTGLQYDIMYFDSMWIDVDANLFIWSANNATYSSDTYVYNLTSGYQIERYSFESYPQYHRNGVISPCYYNGHIYGAITYTTGYGQGDRRGLIDINLADDSVRYHRQAYTTNDGSGITRVMPTGDGRLLISSLYGIHFFDLATETWTTYDNESVPGLTPSGETDFYHIAYDSANEVIFASHYSSSWSGLVMVSENGFFQTVQYSTGTDSEGTISFDEPTQVMAGLNDSQAAILVTEADEWWVYFARDEEDLAWDRFDSTMEMSSYLTGSLSAQWDLGAPGRLRFSLSMGHLFDPTNSLSALSIMVRKGRLIELDIGDLYEGTEYYQSQGVFMVQECSLSYRVGEHPVIDVDCQHITALWKEVIIHVSDRYTLYPEDALEDILLTYSNLGAEYLSLPGQGGFEGSHNISHQWIDTTLYEAVEELLYHFGYALRMNVDGEFEPIYLDLEAEVSNTYSAANSIVAYTPDLAYSNNTNRVVVKGESLDFVEVTYAEELLASHAGTLGWWGCEDTQTLYFNREHTRRARNLRLHVVERPSINIFWTRRGGGSTQMISFDPYGYWARVRVEAPNLVGVFAAAVVALLVTGIWAIPCDGWLTGWCGFAIFTMSIEASIIMYIMGMVANFSYEIYGNPIGEERMTFQASADDVDYQQEIGLVAEEVIEDPFCYDLLPATAVAERELAIVRAQRNRVKFEKIAHLQDEIGDIIQIPHPFSLSAMRILITTLTRTFNCPSTGGAGGSVTDTIEGWRL